MERVIVTGKARHFRWLPDSFYTDENLIGWIVKDRSDLNLSDAYIFLAEILVILIVISIILHLKSTFRPDV